MTHSPATHLALLLLLVAPIAQSGSINITRSVESVTVEHNGVDLKVMRNQDPTALVDPTWSMTGRNCPPFCVQPLTAAPGVATVGIHEVIQFMQNELTFDEGVIIDARTPDWNERGTIPGSVNIPYTHLNRAAGGDDDMMEEAFEQFGVTRNENGWNFSKAKKLVLWCNGWWCGQSPAAIRGLLSEGYPAEKLFYFRGGMQNWKIYGMTVAH
ncbi:MAG: rhodanese-like domain-containing protein [Gammaproteobacteria bacterium]|nr:rhodanese-like domain-containing protein [Gammaproteobacteria bacterium]MBT3489146.1 rhodanese-like domain-containing protein [Gammaproteobacteria bacterium]MBT3719357.1 rhodanese-like domain-containing protein [Gammaproteobacteria bacterium]MBT3845343.1 rhodanese-like domain-containing protein [Gammaproteobacteria bacterium]MBT3892495.1 rhodanese-like domain-containing protein [Gammaproteobacteria bacterium]